MAKEVLCPICGATYNLAEEQLGKKVRCKKCEHAFTAGGEPRRRADNDEDDEDDDRPRVKSKGKKGRARDEVDDKPKKTKSIEEQAKARTPKEPGIPVSSFVILGVILGGIFLCCGGGAVVWWAVSQKPAKQNAPPPKRGELPSNPGAFAAAYPHPAGAPPVEVTRVLERFSHQRRRYPNSTPTPTGAGGSTTTTGSG